MTDGGSRALHQSCCDALDYHSIHEAAERIATQKRRWSVGWTGAATITHRCCCCAGGQVLYVDPVVL